MHAGREGIIRPKGLEKERERSWINEWTKGTKELIWALQVLNTPLHILQHHWSRSESDFPRGAKFSFLRSLNGQEHTENVLSWLLLKAIDCISGQAALVTVEPACFSSLPPSIKWALLIKLSSHLIKSQIIVILMNLNCFWVRQKLPLKQPPSCGTANQIQLYLLEWIVTMAPLLQPPSNEVDGSKCIWIGWKEVTRGLNIQIQIFKRQSHNFPASCSTLWSNLSCVAFSRAEMTSLHLWIQGCSDTHSKSSGRFLLLRTP